MINWDEIRHFRRSEFGRGEKNVEPDAELVRLLDLARADAGIPFRITSALRTAEDNKRIGGKPDSAHLTGHAVDISCPTARHRMTIVRSLMDVGFVRIGVRYPAHIHVDTRTDLPQDVIW